MGVVVLEAPSNSWEAFQRYTWLNRLQQFENTQCLSFCYLIIVVVVVVITIIAHLHLHLHLHHRLPHCSLFPQCAADAERQQIRAFQTLSTHFEGFSSLGANAAFSKFCKN